MTAVHADWSAAAGQTFLAIGPDGVEHAFVLAGVGEATAGGGWVSYTATFAAPPTATAQQQTYALSGGGIAEDVFLVPTGRSADALMLEAVFTQPDEETE